MKILHVLPSLSYDWGGPPKFVSTLAESLAKKGINVSVFATTDGNAVNHKIEGVETKLFHRGCLSKFWTSYSLPLAKALSRQAADFDLIHIHELWNYPEFAAYRAAKRAKKPYMITIHGQLDPWCLNHKALRKKVYSSLIQKKILNEAAGIHAMTEKGVKNISNFVNSKNIVLVPNGLKKEEFDNLPDRNHIESLYPELRNRLVLLFLGRVTPKKGLDILVKAYGTLLKEIDDVHLLICGPEDIEYKKVIVKLLNDNHAIGKTTFTGMLTGDEKLAAFSRADIFILPSYSEGFSASTLEAMACGLPVIISEHCKFLDLEKLGAGKIIKADAGHLIKALRKLLNNPSMRLALGSKARQLFLEGYTMDKIADKIIAVYREILNKENNA